MPGLPMAIVQAEGDNVRPIESDKFQIATVETKDLIVPFDDPTYSLVTEVVDHLELGARLFSLRRRPNVPSSL